MFQNLGIHCAHPIGIRQRLFLTCLLSGAIFASHGSAHAFTPSPMGTQNTAFPILAPHLSLALALMPFTPIHPQLDDCTPQSAQLLSPNLAPHNQPAIGVQWHTTAHRTVITVTQQQWKAVRAECAAQECACCRRLCGTHRHMHAANKRDMLTRLCSADRNIKPYPQLSLKVQQRCMHI